MKNSKNSENNSDNYIEKLKDIFEYYCQYGERLNSRILKSHGFIKLFRESGLMDKKLNTTRLEIIYKSINKNNQMNFDQFLNSLLKIASYKFNLTDKKDIKAATQKIILENLYPLYYTILNNSSILSIDSKSNIINSTSSDFNNLTLVQKNFENIIYTETFKEILVQVVPILFDIYRAYFTNETSISDNLNYIKNTSIKNYFTLIKNLEIIPYLLSNSACYQIYKMSQITFDKIYNSNNNNLIGDKLSPEEMFILFLQKIEESEGFGNFTKIKNISHNYKTSSIIPPNFHIKFETKKEKDENKNLIEINMENDEEKIDINKNIEIYEPKYINYINEVYGKNLLNLYKTIVNFGDQFNFQYMKSKAFFKFLSDSNLIKNKQNNFGLKLNDVDIFFIKMCILMKNNEKYLTNKMFPMVKSIIRLLLYL